MNVEQAMRTVLDGRFYKMKTDAITGITSVICHRVPLDHMPTHLSDFEKYQRMAKAIALGKKGCKANRIFQSKVPDSAFDDIARRRIVGSKNFASWTVLAAEYGVTKGMIYRWYLRLIEKNAEAARKAPPTALEIANDDRGIKCSSIMQAVASFTGHKITEIKGPRRDIRLAKARLSYYWLARKYSGRSLPHIGKICGDRDHSTVLSGVKRVESNPEKYASIISAVETAMGLRAQ